MFHPCPLEQQCYFLKHIRNSYTCSCALVFLHLGFPLQFGDCLLYLSCGSSFHFVIQIGEMALPNKAKGIKRERREAKLKDQDNGHVSKKQKENKA